jgi:hypothetical protein
VIAETDAVVELPVPLPTVLQKPYRRTRGSQRRHESRQYGSLHVLRPPRRCADPRRGGADQFRTAAQSGQAAA